MLAVLGRSWGLRCRSWAALGAYVGGLGLLLGPMLAVLGALGPKCGPNPEMWPKPEREQGSGPPNPPTAPVRLRIFSVDICVCDFDTHFLGVRQGCTTYM